MRLFEGGPTVVASHPEIGTRYLHVDGPATLLFTENETNAERIHGRPSRTPVREGRVRQLPRARTP